MLDALSPQRRRLVLVVVGLLAAALLAAVVAVVVRRTTPAGPVAQDQPGPVLLVPGYGGDGDSLQPLATALRASGRIVQIVPAVGDGTGDLRTQAEHLGEVAEQAVADSGARSVDVVGYSAGGVVARAWVRDEGGDAIARRVLTVGAPQHGTDQARLGAELAGGCPVACEQLAPDSDLLRQLNAGDESPDGPAWITVRSTADEVVTPIDSAVLDGALNLLVQDSCPDSTTSHGGLPTDPVVRAALASVLGVGPPTAPTGVSC